MGDSSPVELDAALERVAAWLTEARAVAVLTGAGISTDSGIPDFRGPQGVWTRDPRAERMASLQAYMTDAELRREAWQLRVNHPALTARPNPAHAALAALEKKGKLHALITQNIDGLHQKAGSSPEAVIEIHGNIREVVCMACEERAPMGAALDRVRAGEPDPACLSCGGVLKSATISFGQPLDREKLRDAQRAAASCDVFLAAGTSLTVYPAAHLPQLALDAGARLVIMNAQPTRYDRRAAAVIREPLSEALPRIVGRVSP